MAEFEILSVRRKKTLFLYGIIFKGKFKNKNYIEMVSLSNQRNSAVYFKV